MANIFTTLNALTKTKKKNIRDKIVEKKEKELQGKSVIIEPTAVMIQNIAAALETDTDPNVEALRTSVRDASNRKLTTAQVKEIILVAKNIAIYDGDPDNYELQDEGKMLVYIGTPEV